MGMSFYAARFFEGGNYSGPVFDFAEGTTLDLSSGNAALVAETLGFEVIEGMMNAPIDAFIASAEAWLAVNAAPSPAVPTLVDGRAFSHPDGDLGILADCLQGKPGLPARAAGVRGPRMIVCGLPEGYLQERIGRMLELAKAGLAAGATEMVAA